MPRKAMRSRKSTRARKPAARKPRKPSRIGLAQRTFDARPDTLDFRDRMYVPTLVEVPERIPLASYKKEKVPVLDQGREGACTGYGLATVAHYLLRTRQVAPRTDTVSAWMLYAMARRYDEWPGEKYEGSSARGAMKGWHKHGVTSAEAWPAAAKDTVVLDQVRAQDAAIRPLGAYFRVNHRDLVAMHSALAEVKVLYATASVHDGWDAVPASGHIPFRPGNTGGHAFAIVAYDEGGFWIQNSWGTDWGAGGFGRISYDDWIENGTDAWAARLGVPIVLATARGKAATRSALAGDRQEYSNVDLRPHVIAIGNDGELRASGPFATRPADVEAILTDDFNRITKTWAKKRLLLYAHGGLVSEQSAIQRVADYRESLLHNEVYPLAFVWKTDFWSTISNIVKDAMSRRRAEGIFEGAKDFLLDRADDFLEPVARGLGGKLVWDEMKENARMASLPGRGAARVAALVRGLAASGVEVHLAGHSAGSIFLAPMVDLLAGDGGKPISTCTLWAPAVSLKRYDETYQPAIESGDIRRFALYTLTDKVEQDDHCANVYHKSLLYLVAHACEDAQRIPLIRPRGEPLLGLARDVAQHKKLQALFRSKKADWILSPNEAEPGSSDSSTSRHHGDFDDDVPTVLSTLRRITGKRPKEATVDFERSASSRKTLRETLLK